ncbi:MAG: hypothetical protein GQF41_3997 [Candidatus Rifleibacterium amylolyticum]|nr:MAG: hypothetical protein GQF41_3997 [Candidatus Rifleibacterium amylolyticum]
MIVIVIVIVIVIGIKFVLIRQDCFVASLLAMTAQNRKAA